ncbi:MAG: c-type cytochrome [Verrucomicrobia bacterium]|nr:c-type cytochrome [Verrucomicrobiota bacterium]
MAHAEREPYTRGGCSTCNSIATTKYLKNPHLCGFAAKKQIPISQIPISKTPTSAASPLKSKFLSAKIMGKCLTAIHFSIYLIASVSLSGAPDFETQIAPIFEAHCLSCHNSTDAEGDFVLQTKAEALEHPDAILPGNAMQSYLIDQISGLVPAMPDGGDPLSENEVDLVFDWINTGTDIVPSMTEYHANSPYSEPFAIGFATPTLQNTDIFDYRNKVYSGGIDR